MAKRSPKGLSIEDALRRWGDPALLARLHQLGTDADQATADAKEHLETESIDIVEALGQGLLPRLQCGELIARGLVRGAPVTEGKIDIDPDRWAELEFNHDLDEIVGPKRFVMTAVEIREAEPDPDENHDDANAPGPDRVVGRSPSLGPEPADLLWEEGRVLTIRGERMVFRGRVHQAIIDQLVKAHAKGKWLRTETLLTLAGSQSDTLAKAFSGNPNWRTLQRFLRRRSGYSRLEV